MVMDNVYPGETRRRGIPRVQTFSEGMQSKGSQKEKFFGKPWRNRPKVIPNAGNSLWAPDARENCCWISVGGRKVCLTSINVRSLSEPERLALQQVALVKLRKQNLRSHVTIPKDSRSDKRTSSLKRALSLKSRLAPGNTEKDKDSGVFAIPLRKAVAQTTRESTENVNLRKSRWENGNGSNGEENHENSNEVTPRTRRHSSSSLNQQYPRGAPIENDSHKGQSNGNHQPPESPTWKSRLIDALTLLSSSASASCIIDKQSTLSPVPPRVPQIVMQAIEHLECYGLHILGIFRTGGSKKRMKQMREQFDIGNKTQFTAEDNPHDVAALFKQYFRDLPEPLLTRELYSVFLETQDFDDEEQQFKLLQLLCCLLPAPNRDTLEVLLEFLSKVAYFSEDRVDENGIEIPGNKMNSRNLATLMGPNILHKVKSGHHQDFVVEDLARAEERKEIIDVVQDMIIQNKDLFMISAEMYHEVFIHLLENEPEILDYLLRRKDPSRMSTDAEEVFDFECTTPRKPDPCRTRARSTGEHDRPGITRAGSAPNTRPPPEYHKHRRWDGHRNHGSSSPWDRPANSPISPIRSRSLNQEEENLCKQRLFARQISAPEDSLSSNFKGKQKTPPPPPRGIRRYGGSNISEPPSPALSSSVSHSSYSTPPSSPPSTPFYSVESSSPSLSTVSYLGGEGPIPNDLTELLNEVEKDLARERERESLKPGSSTELDFDLTDWQLERWLQWESITQHNSSQRDVLEQETLV